MKTMQSITASPLPFLPMQESLQMAQVRHIGEQGIQIVSQEKIQHAQLAASCILQPNVGDKVLIVALAEAQVYILAILEQASKEQCFQFGPHLSFATSDDAAVLSAEHLEVQAEQHLSLTSPALSLYAAKANANITELHYQGDFLNQAVRHLSTQASLLETVAESQHLHSQRSFSQIDDIRHESIGRSRTLIEKEYRLDCQYADIFAEQDVKIDADQVQLG